MSSNNHKLELTEIDGEPRDTLFERLRDAVGDEADSGEVCPKCGSANKEYQGWILYTELWLCKDCDKMFPTKQFNEDYKNQFGHYYDDPLCQRCPLDCGERDDETKWCYRYLEEIKWKEKS